MRVYGWDDTGLMRGDMQAAQIEAKELEHHGGKHVASGLGWEALFTQFRAARAVMIERMTEFRADPDAIRLVRILKAGDEVKHKCTNEHLHNRTLVR